MSPAEPVIVEETVEELRQAVRRFLDDEDSRAQSLNNRASGLTAFVGVIVPLAGLLVRPYPGVNEGVRTFIAIVAPIGFLLLLLGAAFAVRKVLLPSEGVAVSVDEVKRHPTYQFIGEKSLMVKGRLLRGDVLGACS